jgi:ferric-dicitrate binding protein FerR (iron transport regulator)
MNERIVVLLYKFINDISLEETEKEELNNWLAQSPHYRALFDQMMDSEKLQEEIKEMLSYDGRTIWNKIERREQEKKYYIATRKYRWWYAAAAVLLIMFTVGAYYIFIDHIANQAMSTTTPAEKEFKNDVQPGSEKAILTLANGSKIVLDSLENGAIAQEGNTVIMKEHGLLAYNADNKKTQTEILYNTIAIPRGGEYRSLVLADGTKVWLNSVSSIHFPTAFIGKERTVEITGEVYFEVAHNTAKPFKVKVGDMEVEVLGTHFNINAYEDENSINTTLLEGAVKINKNGKTKLLSPGQQARVDKNGDINVTDHADLDAAVAWKNGIFLFKKDDMETIMRQVSRWYNADVVFEDKIPGHFVATGIPRTVPVSKLLTVFEKMGGVYFEIEGNKIIVKSKK